MASPLTFRFALGAVVWWRQAPAVATEPWVVCMRLYMESADSQYYQYGLVPSPNRHVRLSWAEEADLWLVEEASSEEVSC